MLPDHHGPGLSRRTLLRGGAVLAGTAVLGTGLAGTAHAGSYSRIGTGGYPGPTTPRTGFTPDGGGSTGTHSGKTPSRAPHREKPAARKPAGIEPTSPRKIRAGGKFSTKKPRLAAATVMASIAKDSWPARHPSSASSSGEATT